ncbi:MAG: tyrosine-type recombinase/integrase [Cyanobacteria bacterium P01_E01_bin.34]
MKVKGNGQAKILSAEEMQRLFADGLLTTRDRALFAVCRYTGCRVSEALALTIGDIQGGVVTFRRATTKGKVRTRSVPIHHELNRYLSDYSPEYGWLFPGRFGSRALHRSSADLVLRAAAKRVGIQGMSTHSFRRSSLTEMSNSGIPLRVIQEISGHKSLAALQRYLEVRPEQLIAAVACL